MTKYIALINSQINWDLFDFLAMGLLVFFFVSAYILIARKTIKKSHKIVAAAILGGIFLYIWAELAVGIFTNLGS